MVSKSVVFPWSTWPMTVTTGGRGFASSCVSARKPRLLATGTSSSSKNTSMPYFSATLEQRSRSRTSLRVNGMPFSAKKYVMIPATGLPSFCANSLTVWPSAERIIISSSSASCFFSRPPRLLLPPLPLAYRRTAVHLSRLAAASWRGLLASATAARTAARAPVRAAPSCGAHLCGGASPGAPTAACWKAGAGLAPESHSIGAERHATEEAGLGAKAAACSARPAACGMPPGTLTGASIVRPCGKMPLELQTCKTSEKQR
mmetsp:Transcript_103786/g.289039  ORF Transcript_103786/g.289039 Transcript_103786/m.289039 type:complete len:260 (-) Transcript_103786:3-782(-)